MANVLAPIGVFVYNRPWHAEQALTALQNNELANQSILYIYSDGPKDKNNIEELEKIAIVRKIIRKKQWCKEVRIIELETNKGLANAYIQGVSEIINMYGKAIVLEDDLVTSKFFLKYMNKVLDYYEKYKSVFSVSAAPPPYKKITIPPDYIYDVFVSLRFFSCGWGTWADRWAQVNWEMSYLDDFLANNKQVRAFNAGGEDLTRLLLLQRGHAVDSWSIRFNFSHFMYHAVSICSCKPYLKNIGFDGTGVHCKVQPDLEQDIDEAAQEPIFLDILYQDERIMKALYDAYLPQKLTLDKKISNKIYKVLSRYKPCNSRKK